MKRNFCLFEKIPLRITKITTIREFPTKRRLPVWVFYPADFRGGRIVRGKERNTRSFHAAEKNGGGFPYRENAAGRIHMQRHGNPAPFSLRRSAASLFFRSRCVLPRSSLPRLSVLFSGAFRNSPHGFMPYRSCRG